MKRDSELALFDLERRIVQWDENRQDEESTQALRESVDAARRRSTDR
ncbi:MAG: hypothetical protein HQ526_04815 [Actinobacteria bacterium]|nr:hypothetical protein [Actinomycetota bacterium]